ncbi:MAG: hypothetical protein IT370_28150 [Deltaproteobacteria bacterium]|nr:hypothetical protein [Deltaproteobacteria bacterium]
MTSSELAALLLSGTRLVADLVSGSRPFVEFHREYGDFYHENCLDGFDADDDDRLLLRRFPEAVELHRLVQQICYRTYFKGPGVDEAVYRSAGRVSEEEAIQLLRTEARRLDVSSMVTELEKAAG